MGVIIPQIVTEDRASGAQFIGGSLNFHQASSPFLKFTPTSDGNRSTWTVSFWALIDPVSTSSGTNPFFAATGDGLQWEYEMLQLLANDLYYVDYISQAGGANILWRTNAKFRDIGWYHLMAVKVNDSTFKLYVNGEELTSLSSSTNNGNQSTYWNKANVQMNIGGAFESSNAYSCHSRLSQYYFIDGQALAPTDFAFTDPLTGTWRPKKFSGNFIVSNPNAVNNGTNWNSYFTGDYDQNHGWGTSYQSSHAFDGNLTTVTMGQANSTGLTWTPPGGAIGADATTIRIYGQDDNCPDDYLKINGINYGGLITQGFTGAYTVLKGAGAVGGGITQLESIYLRDNTGGNTHYRWAALEIDGVILVANQDDRTAGTNSFYLPMDGNSPIGEDKSGNGNDFTPVNFGGSNSLDNATGARPILNTTPGGTQARPGVFGSEAGAHYATTSETNSEQKYYFSHDASAQPTFSFIRGATYTFDWSASPSHPLRFSTTVNGTLGGGTEYQDGVDVTGNVTTITVPHDAPPTLYYYCNVHSGMGNSISVTTDESKADPYAWKNVLALPLVGAANDVSNQINNGSTTKSVTVTGPVASSALSNFYGGSYYFDGSNDELNIADSADWDIGSGDFTMEFWMYQLSITNTDAMILNQWGATGLSGVWYIKADSLTQLSVNFRNDSDLNNSGNPVAITAPAVANKWQHIAVTRNGNTWRLFVDGQLQNSATSSITVANATEPLRVGRQGYTSYRNGQPYKGYIQDVRFYKGVAKYTSNFIPAAISPDVLPDTPSGIAVKSKLTKITDGSVIFGSSGYMTTTSSDYNPGTGDFAIEGYFRFPDNSGTRRAFVNDTGPFGTNSMVIRQYNDGFNFYCGGQSLADSGTNMAQWNHALMTRSGSTVRYFVNGELRGTDTTSTNVYAEPTNQLTIGGLYDVSTPAEFMQGEASNLRLTVGSIPTEYQTSSTTAGTKIFIPSSEPLTLTSQGATSSDVKLLCCQSPTSATAATVSSASLSTNNTVTTTNFNPFTSDINAVRGRETGYATLNSLEYYGATAAMSNGNLDVAITSGSGYYPASRPTISPFTAGIKSYCEVTIGSKTSTFQSVGANTQAHNMTGSGDQYVIWRSDGQLSENVSGSSHTGPGGTYTNGDVIGIAYDNSTQELKFYKNNSLAVTWTFLSIPANFNIYTGTDSTNNTGNFTWNFGQKPFKFPPPDGFQTLNFAATRPETVIARPDQFAGATLYTGNGGTKSIDVGHKPDFVWIKARDGSARSHHLFDSVRGVQKILQTDGTAGESSPNANSLTSFNYNGFTTGSKSGMNDNTVNYVTWTWKAGGNKNTFNIDDVGYANASDVNMSVGDLNNVVYASSRTWSNDLSATSLADATKMFDWTYGYGSYTGTCTWTTTNADYSSLSGRVLLANNTTVTIGVTFKDSGGTTLGSFNLPWTGDGTAMQDTGFDWSSSIASVEFTGGYLPVRVHIGDKILVDTGTSVDNAPSIAPTSCSVGTKQGFSIIKYDGTGTSTSSFSTVPHGLSQAPAFMIVKSTSDTSNWYVYHKSIGRTKKINLDSAGTASTNNDLWGSGRGTTANVINLNQGWYASNYSNYTHIIYAWHDVPGFSKFGKWLNTNNNDGAFVELGFKPAVILFTDTDGGESWYFVDNQRHPFNLEAPSNSGPDSIRTLKPNSADNEDSSDNAHPNATIDFLSNGFKIRSTNVSSGEISYGTRTYVYAAWAEAPISNLFGSTVNAQ